ncbi:unnamed protein product [Gadus morhua 'NCC']
MAGSAGRRKRVLEPGAGEAAEDQQDCGVLLFSDRPDRCPVQPDETATVLRKRSPRLRDLSRTPASESIFCCSLCYKAFISSSSLEAHHKASHKTFSFSSSSSSLETNHKGSSSSSLETNHKASSSSSSSSSSSLKAPLLGARPTQRPHPCAVCSRSFRRPCLLREHLKSHGPGRTGPPGHGSAQEPVSQPDASEPRDLSTKPSAGNHGDPAGRPEDEEDKAADRRGEEDVSGLINSDGEEEYWESPSRTEGASSYNFDIAKKSDLTRLYNSKVYKAERMWRPLGILGTTIGPISHTGFVVTLEDGSRWLIHKGNGFGNSSQTVVVDVKHMSSDWKTIKKNNFKGKKTVADFVADGGSKYCLLFNNCRDATTRMMTPFRE